jgi:hypothetical protein
MHAALPAIAEVCSGVQACLSMHSAAAPLSSSVSAAVSLFGASDAQCKGVFRSCWRERMHSTR